ncbi:MAG: hypothetical protein EOO54_16745 [Haliea sp.]|nr:MAG: hypothetical protein EOO54_16745 [Haliea sp.]
MTYRPLRLAPLLAVAFLAGGCAQFLAGPYSADYQALDRMKAARPGTAAVATVQPVEPAHPVNRLSLRGAALLSPSGTFAKYLENALIADLKEAQAYDAASRTVLHAVILKNDVDVSGVSTGSATMEVQLSVTRDGQRRLDRRYQASISFDSHFMGNIAIPAGQAAYAGVVRELLRNVYADPQFVAAIGK